MAVREFCRFRFVRAGDEPPPAVARSSLQHRGYSRSGQLRRASPLSSPAPTPNRSTPPTSPTPCPQPLPMYDPPPPITLPELHLQVQRAIALSRLVQRRAQLCWLLKTVVRAQAEARIQGRKDHLHLVYIFSAALSQSGDGVSPFWVAIKVLAEGTGDRCPALGAMLADEGIRRDGVPGDDKGLGWFLYAASVVTEAKAAGGFDTEQCWTRGCQHGQSHLVPLWPHQFSTLSQGLTCTRPHWPRRAGAYSETSTCIGRSRKATRSSRHSRSATAHRCSSRWTGPLSTEPCTGSEPLAFSPSAALTLDSFWSWATA